MTRKTKTTSAAGLDSDTVSTQDAIAAERAKPLVFVSHDTRDADLAEAFSNLLTDSSGGVLRSFRSSDRKGTAGIDFGTEWYKAIMEKLATATDVVALLTQNSINRPWLLYEAGVAKGKLGAVVFGVALGIPLENAVIGPFAQFQNSGDDSDALTKLVLQLIRRNPDAQPREEAVRMQVQAFKDSADRLMKERGKSGAITRVDESTVAKLFEEVKVMFRDLPTEVEEKLQSTIGRGRFRHRRFFHPGVIEHLFFGPHMHGSPVEEALGWMMLATMWRDDAPWFYEVAIEVSRALRSADTKRIDAAKTALAQTIEFARHSPIMEEFMMWRGPDKEGFMLLRHLPEMLEDVLKRSSLQSGQIQGSQNRGKRGPRAKSSEQ